MIYMESNMLEHSATVIEQNSTRIKIKIKVILHQIQSTWSSVDNPPHHATCTYLSYFIHRLPFNHNKIQNPSSCQYFFTKTKEDQNFSMHECSLCLHLNAKDKVSNQPSKWFHMHYTWVERERCTYHISSHNLTTPTKLTHTKTHIQEKDKKTLTAHHHLTQNNIVHFRHYRLINCHLMKNNKYIMLN